MILATKGVVVKKSVDIVYGGSNPPLPTKQRESYKVRLFLFLNSIILCEILTINSIIGKLILENHKGDGNMEQAERNMREYLEYDLHFTKDQIEELYQKNTFLGKILSGDVADEIRFLKKFKMVYISLR